MVLGVSNVNADESNGANFSITPVYSDVQTDNTLGYISINTTNDSNYTVSVKISNLDSENKANYRVKLVNATTNDSGSIDYSPNKQKLVKGKDPFLTDLIAHDKISKKIFLNPKETKEVSFNIKTPKDGFKGTILGSIYVIRDSKTLSEEKKFGFTNKFAMTMPVVINRDSSKKILPELSLNKVKLGSYAGELAVVADLKNAAPVMFGEIDTSAWVTKQSHSEKLFSKKAKNYSMAPRSIFGYQLPTNNKSLAPGKYTFYLDLKSGAKTYKLRKNFIVEASDNNTVKKYQVKSNNWIWWAVSGLIATLLLVIVWLIYKLGRRNNEKS